MSRWWIVVAASLLIWGAQAQEQGQAPKPKGGLTGGLTTVKVDMEAAEQAIGTLATSESEEEVAEAALELKGTLDAIRPHVRTSPNLVLPQLQRLEEGLLDATYSAAGAGEPAAQEAYVDVLELRKVALKHSALGSGSFTKRTRLQRPVARGGAVVGGGGGAASQQTGQRTSIQLLEEQYAKTRELLKGEREEISLLAGLAELDLRMVQLAANPPEDPGKREYLATKLQEGERLIADLAQATYLAYKSTIEQDPAAALVVFTSYLHETPEQAKRARRQASLLLTETTRVWHREHVARDLFKVDPLPRVARLRAVAEAWEEAIGDELGHPLEVELVQLERRLASVERELERKASGR